MTGEGPVVRKGNGGVKRKGAVAAKPRTQATKVAKVSKVAKNSVPVAIGGFVAYAGVIVLLIGLGLLGAYGLEQAGLAPVLAAGIAIGAVGLIVAGVGVGFVLKGVNAIKKGSLKPEKTQETIEAMKEIAPGAKPKTKLPEPEDNRSSQEIKKSVCATEDRISITLGELERRLTLTTMREHAKEELGTHPYKWSLIAMGTGFASSLLMKKKVRPSFLKLSALAVRTLVPLLTSKMASRKNRSRRF